MSKTFDLSKKSDMRRFSREIESNLKDVAREGIQSNGVDYPCPHCEQTIHVHGGHNVCPYCHKTVEVTFDFSKL